jgi:hypothetical protein
VGVSSLRAAGVARSRPLRRTVKESRVTAAAEDDETVADMGED